MLLQPLLVAAISICGVLVGATLQYLFGRALESRKQLVLQRSQAYVDYFKVVALIAQGGRSKEHLSLAADAKVRICIYGSPEVIRHLHAFETAGANTGGAGGRLAIIRLLKEVRGDVGKDNREIDGGTVQDILFGLHQAERP